MNPPTQAAKPRWPRKRRIRNRSGMAARESSILTGGPRPDHTAEWDDGSRRAQPGFETDRDSIVTGPANPVRSVRDATEFPGGGIATSGPSRPILRVVPGVGRI